MGGGVEVEGFRSEYASSLSLTNAHIDFLIFISVLHSAVNTSATANTEKVKQKVRLNYDCISSITTFIPLVNLMPRSTCYM